MHEAISAAEGIAFRIDRDIDVCERGIVGEVD
jgi:hypothetical protein